MVVVDAERRRERGVARVEQTEIAVGMGELELTRRPYRGDALAVDRTCTPR